MNIPKLEIETEEYAEKECVALLVVSDNTVQNKSLISCRTDKDMKKYHHIRYSIIPNIIFSLMLE